MKKRQFVVVCLALSVLGCSAVQAKEDEEDTFDSLREQYYTESIRTGTLQIEVNKLRRELADMAASSRQGRVSELEEELQRLRKQLENDEVIIEEQERLSVQPFGDWRDLLVYLSLAGFAGVLLGLFLSDMHYRRRFGGMRLR
ncbi:MAG: hypothetical protein ACYYK0_01145 [Candidatus Eutrophobiaceae bacterium]